MTSELVWLALLSVGFLWTPLADGAVKGFAVSTGTEAASKVSPFASKTGLTCGAAYTRAARVSDVTELVGSARSCDKPSLAPAIRIRRLSFLRTTFNCYGSAHPNVTVNRVKPTDACNIWQPARLGAMASPPEPWADGGGIFEVLTPHGPGFKVVATPEMTAPWGGKQAWLVDYDHLIPLSSFLGTVQTWSGMFMLPSSGNPNGVPRDWHAGVLWEFHTETTSGHHIAIDGSTFANPRLRFGIAKPDGSYGFVHSARRLKYDYWYPWTIKVKWSYGADGFLRASIGKELRVNRSGATLIQGEHPKLQFGYYATEKLRNEVWFAAVSRS